MKNGSRVEWVQSVQTGTMDLVKKTCEGTLIGVDGSLAWVLRDYDQNVCMMGRGQLSLVGRARPARKQRRSKRSARVS